MRDHFSVKFLRKALKLTFLFLLFFGNGYLVSQNNNTTSNIDTSSTNTQLQQEQLFKKAKHLIDQGNFLDAALLLKANYPKFTNALNINWLYAYALWYTDQTREAKLIFQKAIQLTPNNRELQSDYIQFLYQTEEIILLESILEKKRKIKNSSFQEKLMLARVYFWRGKIKSARSLLSEIRKDFPENNDAKKLEQEINEITASYVHLKTAYQTDSQPLEYFANQVEIGEYFSRYFSPKLSISSFRFSPLKQETFSLKVSNEFLLDKVDLKLTTSIGIYNNLSDDSDWIGGIHFNKSLFENMTLQFGFDKNPLLTTIASTRVTLTEQRLYGSFDFQNNYLLFNASFQHAFYVDDNYINSISTWVVSQPIQLGYLNFQLGYGFNFMDAKEILFVYDALGNGIYDPYFTPEEQVVHSVLAILNYKVSDKLTIETKLNYGIEATVQNPYPILTAPNVVEIGGFYNAPFDYKEFIGSINYTLSNHFQVNASYLYQETFFYDRNNFSLGINYRF